MVGLELEKLKNLEMELDLEDPTLLTTFSIT